MFLCGINGGTVCIDIRSTMTANSVVIPFSKRISEKAFDNLSLSDLLMAISRMPNVVVPIMAKRIK